MAQVGEAVSGRDTIDIETTAVVLDEKLKMSCSPPGPHLHLRGLGMACDVMRGFAEEQEDLPMKLQRGGGTFIGRFDFKMAFETLSSAAAL